MRSRYLPLALLVGGVCLASGMGCGNNQTASETSPTKLSSQQLETEVQKIQNAPQVPADEKARLIRQLRARNAVQR
jgi:hypothetical protein